MCKVCSSPTFIIKTKRFSDFSKKVPPLVKSEICVSNYKLYINITYTIIVVAINHAGAKAFTLKSNSDDLLPQLK